MWSSGLFLIVLFHFLKSNWNWLPELVLYYSVVLPRSNYPQWQCCKFNRSVVNVITQAKVVLAFLNCIADVYVYSFYWCCWAAKHREASQLGLLTGVLITTNSDTSSAAMEIRSHKQIYAILNVISELQCHT